MTDAARTTEQRPRHLSPGAWDLHHEQELLTEFEVELRALQAQQARLWASAAALVSHYPESLREHAGDQLALAMNVHPRTGRALAHTAVAVAEVPGLLAHVAAGHLTDRHVHALLEEASRWTDDEQAAQQVLAITVDRCAARAEAGHGWPTPHAVRERVRTVALLLDLTAAEKARRSASDRRGVAALPVRTATGSLSIEGPDVMVGQMMAAVRARAEALGRLPGDQRTTQQRMFDAAFELLTVDADQPATGGASAVATVDDEGQPLSLRVRGAHLAVVIPFSVAAGGDHELAEIPGYGPVLPSTARELLAHAAGTQRVAVDAATGRVLAVDAPVEQPTRERTDDLDPVLRRLATEPVVVRDLTSGAYRVPARLRRFVEHRDRTCVFPGCTVPGRYCDVDHREPWPRGATSAENCHCLCRRHHRLKQTGLYAVELDLRGATTWTHRTGRQYRRPPPAF